MTVDYAYKYILWQMNKNQAGSLSATEFGYLFNSEQIAMMNDLLGVWQKNNNSKQGNLTGLIENQTILNKLVPFTVKTDMEVTDGVCICPDDYVYILSCTYLGYKVFYLTKDQLFNMQTDVIDPPSISDKKYYFTDIYESNRKKLLMYPKITVAGGEKPVLYTVNPPTPVLWNFTIVSGRQVYASAGSVQPLWDELTAQEICNRCLKKLGVHFKDGDFVNYGNSVIQTAN